MRRMITRAAVIGAFTIAAGIGSAGAATAAVGPAHDPAHDSAHADPVWRNESCPIGLVTRTGIETPWAAMCVVPHGSDRDYGLGALLWIGPDWGEPSLGSYVTYDA